VILENSCLSQEPEFSHLFNLQEIGVLKKFRNM